MLKNRSNYQPALCLHQSMVAVQLFPGQKLDLEEPGNQQLITIPKQIMFVIGSDSCGRQRYSHSILCPGNCSHTTKYLSCPRHDEPLKTFQTSYLALSHRCRDVEFAICHRTILTAIVRCFSDLLSSQKSCLLGLTAAGMLHSRSVDSE